MVEALFSLTAAGFWAAPGAEDLDFFEKKLRPLLAERCFECHGESKPKHGLQLTSRAAILKGGESGPAAVPGKPEERLLLKVVRHHEKPCLFPKEKVRAGPGGCEHVVMPAWSHPDPFHHVYTFRVVAERALP
jgi:hypothetical protein